MSGLSRRNFVLLSSGAALGNMVVAGTAAAEEAAPGQLDFSASGLVTGRPKPLKYEALPGFLSARQIAPHHEAHYGGALKGYVAAESRLEKVRDYGEFDPVAFGALKRSINSRANSVVLHELYFDGMAAKGADPGDSLRVAIEKRFGSVEYWAVDFLDSAKEAAGWAMLTRHPVNGKLYNVVSDEHAIGVLWMAVPLVVIDTYEHAFYIDYQNRKAEYAEKFLDHIDWQEAETRYRAMNG
jgi:superoxide dismutase, Fe-Mn family